MKYRLLNFFLENWSKIGRAKNFFTLLFGEKKILPYCINYKYMESIDPFHSNKKVKDVRSQVLLVIKANFLKKTLKCHFELNFNNFQKKNWNSLG